MELKDVMTRESVTLFLGLPIALLKANFGERKPTIFKWYFSQVIFKESLFNKGDPESRGNLQYSKDMNRI